MVVLGTLLMVVGAAAVAAALLSFAGPGLRELGFTLIGGATSPRGALAGGALLVAAGALVRRRALRARGGA